MKSYTFADVATLSGASPNELKHWVLNNKVIRPDITESPGSGHVHVFGFHDVFEACVAHALNQLPRISVERISYAIAALQLEAALPDTPWRVFLNPATRDWTSRRFWLVLGSKRAPLGRVVDRADRDRVLRELGRAIVSVRLDTLLCDLELRTHDHATDADCANAFTKRDPSVVDVGTTSTTIVPRPDTTSRTIAAKSRE